MKTRSVLELILIALLSLGLLWGVFYTAPAEAAVGDGILLYGKYLSNKTLQKPYIRQYTVSGGTWGTETSLTAMTAGGTIDFVKVKANPQVNEYVGVVTSDLGGGGNSEFGIYTCSAGTWTRSYTIAAWDSAYNFQAIDVAFEQDSGDCLVVYSNGNTANPLSYYTRYDGSWSGPTTLKGNLISTACQHVRLESRPNSDEIACVFNTTDNELDALIWNGSSWNDEPTALLSSTLSTDDMLNFDVAYEQLSGDLLVVYSIENTDGTGMARHGAGGGNTWQNTANDGTTSGPSANPCLTAEPGTNYIAFGAVDLDSSDLQCAIWDSSWTSGDLSFAYVLNDADTSATSNLYCQTVACGWVGAEGSTRRAVIGYRNAADSTGNVYYFSWNKSSTLWEQAADNPATYTGMSLVSSSLRGNWIVKDPLFSVTPTNKLWYTGMRSNSELWTFTYDGTTWATKPTGTYAVAKLTNTGILPSRAAFTDFGPTLVELTGLQAEAQGDKSVITWRTASELRTRGFRLYRTLLPGETGTYEELTRNIVPAWGNPFSGRQYQFTDEDPLPGSYYILEEVLKDGDVKRFRPVQVNNTATFIGGDAQEQAGSYFLRRDGMLNLQGNVLSHKVNGVLKPKAIKQYDRNFNPLKIEVNREGVYRISASDMVKAGWDISNVVPSRVAVYNQGEQIPVYVSGHNDDRFSPSGYIEFYGKPASGRYTRTNIYWLEAGQPGLRMPSIDFNYGKIVTAAYNETAHLEDNASYYSELKGSEHWFFSTEFISPTSADFNIGLDHIVRSADKAVLTVAFKGCSRWGWGPDYNRQRAVISLNGAFVGEANWTGDEACVFSQDVPVSLLAEGDNKVTIEAPDEDGGLNQFFLLKSIDITYPRELLATKNRIIFNAGADQGVTSFRISGFTSPDIAGFAINDNSVSRLDNLKIQTGSAGTFSAVFSDPQPANKHYILVGGTRDKPSDIYPDMPSSLKDKGNQADYIAITHASLSKGLEPLVDLRRSQGLTVKVVDVQDIYDEFNYGIFSPEAIRNFLKYAYENWKRPRPTFVLLVGDGTFDYRDYWQTGMENLVPVYLVYSPDFGETVSDNWFVDFNDDRMPEMFIGRFPVRNEAQLGSLVNKILAYESTSPNAEWTKRLLFVADNDKVFEEASDSLIGLVPSNYTANKLYLSSSTPQETRQGIIDNLNQGSLIFNYAGHGAITMLSQALIFQNSDVASLNNELKPTVFLALDCAAGYFIYPEGIDSISEVLLSADKKGAVAAIASSGTSSIPEQKIFTDGFYKAFFEADGAPVLGALHFRAKGYLYENRSLIGVNPRVYNVIETFNLLGDPAMKLRKDGTPSDYSVSQIIKLQGTAP